MLLLVLAMPAATAAPATAPIHAAHAGDCPGHGAPMPAPATDRRHGDLCCLFHCVPTLAPELAVGMQSPVPELLRFARPGDEPLPRHARRVPTPPPRA